MVTKSEPQAAALERLSALVDGELEAGTVAHACAYWRDSPESRSSWHAYHLIGDVLRADDLACDPASDAAFLKAFRARLVNEPVVLAPQPLADRSLALPPATAQVVNGVPRGRWSWMLPSALAAGFVAVAGTVLLTRAPSALPERGAEASLAAGASSSAAGLRMAAAPLSSVAVAAEPQTFVASNQLIRDVRLDRYLDAHKQFAGSSALGVPSAFLRSATTVAASDR